ncbi:MAG: heterodisulfide reductase-related iron-sulfur binding cluster [Dehalococcoidales bacterium]|nr:heterodisulfide reductase-related iron-sulfur binding cluster [Dehalococcoidales bacterium]
MWDATKCNLCGDCLVKCQYVNYDKSKAIAEIKALMEGMETDIAYKCVTCCACRQYCPTQADPLNLIMKAVEKAGTFPTDEKELMARTFEVPSQLIAGDADKPTISLCTMERYIPASALAGQLFNGMTVVKGGDYYCLIGWEHSGKESLIEKYAQRFINNLTGIGKSMVFLHDDCYAMVHVKVKDYGIKVPFHYMHIFEYLRDYLYSKRNNIKKLERKVAYQQPCASRYTPEKDAFLDEIFHLIGVQRPARKYERETTLCCTAPIINIRTTMAVEFQEKNIKDAIDCGADALITLCPVCDRILRRPTDKFGLTKIYITDLCRIALGEEVWPTTRQ